MTQTPNVQNEVARLGAESNAALDAFDKAEKARADLKAAQKSEREALDKKHHDALKVASAAVTKAAKVRDRAAGLLATAQRAAKA